MLRARRLLFVASLAALACGVTAGGNLLPVLSSETAIPISNYTFFHYRDASQSLEQADWIVPDDIPTIQSAIEHAVDGDLIVVLPGIYCENIDFSGKEVIVQSMDPDNADVVAATVIQGDGKGSAVIFQGGEKQGTVLAGFTVTGGGGTRLGDYWGCFGGGILVTGGGTPGIVNNVITGNVVSSPGFGGGIAVIQSAPYLGGNLVTGHSQVTDGGGVYIFGGTPVLSGNSILDNRARRGGGIFIGHASTAAVAHNLLAGNSAGEGGGMFVVRAAPDIRENIFEDNSASRYGGGVAAWRSDLIILNNTFSYNAAGIKGGAVCLARDAIVPLFIRYRNRFRGNTPDRIFHQAADYS